MAKNLPIINAVRVRNIYARQSAHKATRTSTDLRGTNTDDSSAD
jgi:hypothetical protein